MDRPSHVPADWIRDTRAGCGCPVWRDPLLPEVEGGARRLIVCPEPACAMRAIMRLPSGAGATYAETSGLGWRVRAENYDPPDAAP